MSTQFLFQFLGSAAISIIFMWQMIDRQDRYKEADETELRQYVPPVQSVLPATMLVLFLIGIPYVGIRSSAAGIFSEYFGIFLHIASYELILLLLLPILRRKINARACAALWSLPNFLYVCVWDVMKPDRPHWIIQVPIRVIRLLAFVWLCGASAVLLWKIAAHLVFRYRILHGAKQITDPATCALWEKLQEEIGLKKLKYRLMQSSAVKTPLSIGLFSRSIRVVLPVCDYTPQELQMIFLHELVHIGRADASVKFFQTFCTAVCWFNPLMWITMRKSAEDLELSCDELVLLEADTATRKQYAELLLKTAGQEQGFTTCLSASASSLRYRLKNTVHPRKRGSGTLVLGLLSFVLLITCGQVALAYETDLGHHGIFQDQNLNLCKLTNIYVWDDSYAAERFSIDEEALLQYLDELPLQTVTGGYAFSENEHSVVLLFDTPKGQLGVDLQDTTLRITKFWTENLEQTDFYVANGIDWELLDGIMPTMPALKIRLFTDQLHDQSSLSGSLASVIWTKDGCCQPILTPSASEETPAGLFGALDYTKMSLDFSQPPLSGYTVVMEDHSSKTTVTMTELDLDETGVFSLPSCDARYTVYASFAGPENSIYDVVFCFELGII